MRRCISLQSRSRGRRGRGSRTLDRVVARLRLPLRHPHASAAPPSPSSRARCLDRHLFPERAMYCCGWCSLCLRWSSWPSRPPWDRGPVVVRANRRFGRNAASAEMLGSSRAQGLFGCELGCHVDWLYRRWPCCRCLKGYSTGLRCGTAQRAMLKGNG
jgi:hypothetical protein